MLGSVRRTAGILLVATALLVVPGCSPLQAGTDIGLLREGNQFTLLVMSCDQSTVEDLSFGTGEGLGGEVQTQLTYQFDVSPQETVEFELNGLVPPSTTRDSAPQFPFFTVVRFSDGIVGVGSKWLLLTDGWRSCGRISSRPPALGRPLWRTSRCTARKQPAMSAN